MLGRGEKIFRRRQVNNLQDRLSNHDKMPCVKRQGGTYVHVHNSSSNVELRRAEESNLIAKWDLPCNKE